MRSSAMPEPRTTQVSGSEGYFCTLKKSVCEDYCKCSYCDHLNDRCGCLCHGYTCKNCNKVIYREYLPRAPIRFSFIGDAGQRYLNFTIHSYDETNQRLFVYRKPLKSGYCFSVPPKEVPEFLAKHTDKYEELTIDGKKVLAFHLPERGPNRVKAGICVHEVGHPPYKKVKNEKAFLGYDYILEEKDHKQHCKNVTIYKGQEYNDKYNIPVYDMLHVLPTYKHSPARRDENLSRRIIHAARQVCDCGYYYQDGRTAFYDTQLEWMTSYVKHFTDLKFSNFKKFLKICKKDGPGFICQLAEYIEAETGVEQYVENRPNMVNVMIGVHKLWNGSYLSEGECSAMVVGLSDKEVRSEWFRFLESLKTTKSNE